MHGNQELQRYLEDSLPENEASSMEAWLDQDPSRWKRLEELADDHALVANLRHSLPAIIYQHEPQFQRAMADASTAAQSDSPTVSQRINVAARKTEPDHVSLEGYRVIRQLGSGGMGAVYEAEHELMQKRVAVKVMAPRYLQDSIAVERFMAEMVAIGKLNHVNLVRGLDARRENGRLYLIMEYLEAEDLAAYRLRTGPLPLHVSCDIVGQAALGLAHAHQQGIIHRDIKPSNLMLTDDGVVKVLDLGLARLESEQATTHLTSALTILGTPDYISPEQVQTPRDVDARADIYSLGCTFFFLLTGKSPVHRHTQAMSKLMAHINESPTLPADVRQQIPEPIAQILTKLTHKDRNLRFQSAGDVVEAIAPFCEPIREGRAPQTKSAQPQLPNVASPMEIRRRSFHWRPVALAAAVPLIMIFAFGITLLIETQNGTIELQLANSSQLAEIDVGKDQTITIRDPNDKQPIEITVDRRNQMLRLRKKGFKVFTKDFQLNVNGQKLHIVFIPLETAAIHLAETSAEPAGNSNAADSVISNQIAISHRGKWLIDNGEIVQMEIRAPGQLLMFGDPTWTEYDLSFEGRVPNQTRVHGFSGMFHLTAPNNYVAFGIGIYYNRGHEVSRFVHGTWDRTNGMYTDGTIEPDQWQQVRIQVRGETAHSYLNDQLLFVSHEPLFESGRCGLATYDTRARFRNLLVKSPDGRILWKGLPTSIKDAE